MRSHSTLGQIIFSLTLLTISTIAIADHIPSWPAKISINPVGYNYQNKKMPNYLECEIGQYDGRYSISQIVNVDATKLANYEFAYAYTRYFSKELHFNYLKCYANQTSNQNNSGFICYDLAIPGSINIQQGLASGQCKAI